MHTPNHPSPMLMAVDLVRVDIDAMGLQDLEAHATAVQDTIEALNEFINGMAPKSPETLLSALRRARKLRMHMARVRDLIQARQSAVAVMQGMQLASAPGMFGMPSMGRRSRVIRPLTSADNAASGHIQVLSNDPQGSGAKAVCGGEAKEAGARPHDGEDSMQAKR